jgi:hypothetical protein
LKKLYGRGPVASPFAILRDFIPVNDSKRLIWAVAVNLFFNRKTMDCMFTRFLAILIALPQTFIIILYDGTHFWVMKLFAVIMIVKRAFWILL